jgi:hypothetical protein
LKVFHFTQENWERVLEHFRATLGEVIQSGPIVGELKKPSKNREQEAKYHCLIRDIARTVALYGKSYDEEVWKAKLVEDFDQELKEQGTPLRKPGRVTLSLDLKRMITVRPSTKDFTQQEGAEFIEYLYARGTEFGAQFSDKATEYYESVLRSKGQIK